MDGSIRGSMDDGGQVIEPLYSRAFVTFLFFIFFHTFWASPQTLITGEAHALVPVIRLQDSSWPGS